MSEITLRARAVVGGHLHDDVSVRLSDGRISAVEIHQPAVRQHESILVPGFIDLHVHGGAGADFMDGDPEAVRQIVRLHARGGTAAVAATTLSGSHEATACALRTVQALPRQRQCAEIAAIHLEGPFINPDRAGAQDRSSIRPADIRELQELRALVPSLPWIVTLAPEVTGARAMLTHFRGELIFSIGHTNATFGMTAEALELGASHFTHLFNAMPPMLHREPGPVAAALNSTSATVELLADGVHVHPAVLRFVALSLPSRTILVTDAMRACGMPGGHYRLYEHDVVVSDGEARLADGRLAGSTLTMMDAVRNMIELVGLPLETVLPFATTIPARIIGIDRRKGRIEEGFDGDVLVISDKLQLQRVVLAGEEVELA